MVGESNELAYTAARKACFHNHHTTIHFLYIVKWEWGKTHLLNAIGLRNR